MKNVLIFVIGLFLIGLGACKKKNDNPTSFANVRIVHGIPDGGSLEVRLNNTLVSTIGTYALSMPYSSTVAGTVTVQVRKSGTATDVLNATINAATGNYYSIVLADSLSKLKSSVVLDDPTPASGKAKINILHLGNLVNTASFTSSTGTVLSTTRNFNDQQTSPLLAAYINVDPGSLTIEARTPGTSGAVGIISSATQTLTAGKSYTFVYRNPLAPSIIPAFTFIAN